MNVALFCVLASFWGGSFIAIKYVVAALPPVTGAAVRVLIGLVILRAILGALRRDTTVSWESRWRLWVTGLFSQGLPFALLFWGERRISAGLAGLINGTVPLWTFLIGTAAGREPASRRPGAWAGVGLGLVGAGLIFAPSLGRGGEALGAAACLGMALCYATAAVLARTVLAGERPVDVYAGAFHQQVGSTVFLAALAAALSGGATQPLPTGAALAGEIYLGVCSTALAFLIYFRLIRDWGSLKASTVTYVMPIVTLALDRVFFGRLPRALEAAGCAVVLCGIAVLHAEKLRA
ncbi:MAG: DMT family transporter [Elusimicrobia bacterium]|nr:DMT family transporter [Elusimicrobiota bacterium]